MMGQIVTLRPLVAPPPKTELPFVKLDAVLTRQGELVVFAWPDCDDENHNCDYLGCGFDHVLWRGRADNELRSRFEWLEAKEVEKSK